MLNKGVINGKRLFSEEYYEQSICEYSCGGFPECTPYGLGWWIGKDLEIPYFLQVVSEDDISSQILLRQVLIYMNGHLMK